MIEQLQRIDTQNHPILYRENGHSDTSKRYQAIPTISMVKKIESEGWIPHEIIENNVRKPNREGFQTHRVFFHHPDLPTVNGTIPRIMLTNSYDARKAYTISLGLLRFVCANGMFVSTNWSSYSVTHTGDAFSEALKATQALTENAPKVVQSIEKFLSIQTDRDLRLAFNREAIQLRHNKKEIEIEPTARYLDSPNRFYDHDSDLWTLFNRVQENMIRGKYRYLPKKTDENPWPRSKKAREIKAIDASDKVNKGLWELTEKFAGLISEPKQLSLLV